MTDSERIIKVKEFSGMSFSKLAEYVGLNTVQTLYDIKNGKHGISKDVAEKIQAKYLNVNIAWLLTGEGEMLNRDSPVQHVIGDQNTAVQGNGNNVNATAILEKIFESLRDQQKMIQEHYSKSQEQVTKAQELVSKAQEQMDRLITLLERR